MASGCAWHHLTAADPPPRMSHVVARAHIRLEVGVELEYVNISPRTHTAPPLRPIPDPHMQHEMMTGSHYFCGISGASSAAIRKWESQQGASCQTWWSPVCRHVRSRTTAHGFTTRFSGGEREGIFQMGEEKCDSTTTASGPWRWRLRLMSTQGNRNTGQDCRGLGKLYS